mmetsp:Transcript_22250/g.63486  ORF Transcript_22250/g.63486 Transcript_22250/m.63486 type:complete len:210 (+) Transcript_22250:735-1364(+)
MDRRKSNHRRNQPMLANQTEPTTRHHTTPRQTAIDRPTTPTDTHPTQRDERRPPLMRWTDRQPRSVESQSSRTSPVVCGEGASSKRLLTAWTGARWVRKTDRTQRKDTQHSHRQPDSHTRDVGRSVSCSAFNQASAEQQNRLGERTAGQTERGRPNRHTHAASTTLQKHHGTTHTHSSAPATLWSFPSRAIAQRRSRKVHISVTHRQVE